MERKVVSGIMLTVLLISLLTLTFNIQTAAASVLATIDIDPNTLNLKSKGKWISCHIKLPEGYNVSDVDRATIRLNGSIPVDPFWVDKPLKSVIGDCGDGIPHLMVKFNRTAVREFILCKGIMYGNVTLTITGEVDGALFEGSDTIMGRMPGDVNSDGIVDIVDVVTVAVALGSTDPYTDLNEDENTDICDIVTVAINFGNTY